MFYNCHIHTFKFEDVPDRYVNKYLTKICRTKIGSRITRSFLRNLIPVKNDILDKYAKFLRTGGLGSQEKIFEKCARFYPEDTKFIVLAMDMEYQGAGKTPRGYEEQIEELGELREKCPETVIPFFHVDPRRPNVLDLLKHAVEDLGFKGIKLYTTLGYFPYDERLYPIYEYCEEKNLPVLTHSSPYSATYFKGKRKELKRLLKKSKTNIVIAGRNKRRLCSHFSDPRNYEYVLRDFKKLRLGFAHFGSEYYWIKYLFHPEENHQNWMLMIKELIKKYDNVYADISFTLNQTKFFPLLKTLLADEKLRSRILFGSDYYMVEIKANERRFGLELRGYIGEENFKAIAVDNPIAFLGV